MTAFSVHYEFCKLSIVSQFCSCTTRKRMLFILYPLVKFYIILQLTANTALSKRAVYLSRHGDDSSSCGTPSLPCRTISYAIHQASEGSYIYLDGSKTSRDPFTCQPLDPRHQGIYLTKSISFVGYKSRAYISCLYGNKWLTNGTKHNDGIRVSFDRLAFHNTSLRFLDVLVKINDTMFVDCNDVNMDFAIFNLSYFTLTMNNVVFQRNVICMVIKSAAGTNISINVTNSIFTQNGNGDLCATGNSSILSLNGEKNDISIALRNCMFIKNTFNKFGNIINVDNIDGMTRLLLNQFTVEGNVHSSFIQGHTFGIFRLQSAKVVVVIKFVFISSTFGTFLNVSGQSVRTNISNIRADGFYSPGLGGVVHIIGRSHVIVKDSRFRNGKSGISGGAVALTGGNLIAITIQNCTFHSVSARDSGGAVFFQSRYSTSVGVMKITDSSFAGCSAIQSGAVLVIVGTLFATISNSSFVRISHTAVKFATIENCTVSVRNVYFNGNFPDKAHAALFVWTYFASPSSNSISFMKNKLRPKVQKSNIFSSGFKPKSSNITITNLTFVRNSCAAIKISTDKSSSVKIEHSTFVGNRVIKSSGSVLEISLSSFESVDLKQIDLNSSGNLHHSNVLIENVLFKENIANSGGIFRVSGAHMESVKGKIKLLNCTFVNNFALLKAGQVNSLGDFDMKVYHSVFKQTRQKIVQNQTEFIASSFLKVQRGRELDLRNTTINSTTKSEEPLIVVTGPSKIAVDNWSLITCAKGFALEKTAYFAKNGPNDENFLEFSCKACDYNLYTPQGGHPNGLYVDKSFKCIRCPRGANCVPTITSKPNFWGYCASSSPCTLAFILCPFGYCKSPLDNSSKYNDCQGKRTGVMCGSCSDGYTEALWSTHCTPTKDCNDYWFWIPFLALVLFLAVLFVFKPPFITYLLKHVLWFTRVSTNAANPQEFTYHNVIRFWYLDEEFRHDNTLLSSTEQPNEDKRQFSRFLEIIFYFYQIAHLLRSSYSLNEFFDKKLLPVVLGFFNFEPRLHKRGFLCPFPGLTPKTKLAFKILPVFGTMVAIFIIYFFHIFFNKLRRSRRPSVSSYLQASIKTIFLGYTTLATVAISLIRCVPVAGEDRWFYNGNVICYQWWQYVSLAFNGMFVIPFIFVLAWASFKVYRETITLGQFLLAIAFPLPVLLLWLFRFVFPSERVDVQETRENQNFAAIKEMLLGPYKEPDSKSKYGVMYWQSVLIARRFILVLIFCTITVPSIRLFCMTLACVFVLFFHLKVKPFRNSLANNFESLSLLLLVIIGLINLFKSVFVGFEGNIKGPLVTAFTVFQWVEIVILGLFPALLLLFICLAIISLFLRVLFACCRSLSTFIFRRLACGRHSLEPSLL